MKISKLYCEFFGDINVVFNLLIGILKLKKNLFFFKFSNPLKIFLNTLLFFTKITIYSPNFLERNIKEK